MLAKAGIPFVISPPDLRHKESNPGFSNEDDSGDLKATAFIRGEEIGRGGYGRTLGVLLIDGRSVNRELVAEGWAWQYVNFDKSVELREAQESAR